MNHKHLIVIALALKANKGIGLEQWTSKIANDQRWKKSNCSKRWMNTSDKLYKIPKK